MSFLTPLYLLAGLAILAPILSHLVRKRPREVVEFSSVIFMEDSSPRLTSRNRLEQWLLLALRSMILLAMAMAFSRPYWKSLVEPQGLAKLAKDRILLVDVSASMRREGVWDQAVRKAKEYIADCSPEDSIAVYAMTDRLEMIYGLDQSRNTTSSKRQLMALQGLDSLAPTWLPSDLGRAMVQSLALLVDDEQSESSVKRSEIAILSDFQLGSSIDALGTVQWPSEISVIPIVCHPLQPSNATLSVLASEADSMGSQQSDTLRVAIRNDSSSQLEKLQLKWSDLNGGRYSDEPVDVFVPAGQQQVISISKPLAQEYKQGEPLVLELAGDQNAFDNHQYIYPGKKEFGNAVCIDKLKPDTKDSLWYFANLVPVSQPGTQIDWIRKDPTDLVTQEDMSRWRWVVASSDLNVSWADRLKPAIEQGLHVLWVLDRPVETPNQASERQSVGEALRQIDATDPLEIRKVWQVWFPEDSIHVSEGGSKRFHLLQDIDMSHPIFATFNDPKFNDFTKVRFWKHRRIAALDSGSWDVLACFDDGDPAFIQRILGKGSVTILASGWQPVESQLALSSKFVPILFSILEQASPSRKVPDYRCGDSVPDWIANGVWESPHGDQAFQPIKDDRIRFDSPGIFKANDSDEFLAVNIPRSEGITDRIDLSEFERFGIPIGGQRQNDIEQQKKARVNQLAEQLEASQGGWWWILLSVLIFAGIESMLAVFRTRVLAIQAAG